jgi:hypothetical protein
LSKTHSFKEKVAPILHDLHLGFEVYHLGQSAFGLAAADTGFFALVGLEEIFEQGSWMIAGQAIDRQIHDPPDPHFNEIALPNVPTIPLPGLENLPPAQGALVRQSVDLKASYVATLQAMLTTMERGGGAVEAGEYDWADKQDSQFSAYIVSLHHLAGQIASTDDELSALLRNAGVDLGMIDLAQVAAFQAQLAANGLPQQERDMLALFGLTQQDVQAQIDAMVGADISSLQGVSVLDLLSDADEFRRYQSVLSKTEWTAAYGGSWGVAENWSVFVPDFAGASAQFLGKGLYFRTVTLDGPRTVGSITFDNPNSYLIVPGFRGSITLDNLGSPAVLTVVTGHHEIAAPVLAVGDVNADIVAGAGLNLSKGITLLPGKTLTKGGAGVLSAAFVRGGALAVEAGMVSINSSAMGGGTSDLAGLALSAGTRLDLSDNAMVVRATGATRGEVLSQIGGWIRSGRNGGAWDGEGIVSSAAGGNAAGLTGLGAVLNDDGSGHPLFNTFGGAGAVDVNAVLVKYTWNGDADLNGIVDANDYFRIDRGFAAGGSGWINGDFDYSGGVDANDYFLIDKAFAGQMGVLGAPVAVPEPSAACLIGAGGLIVMGRRRRLGGRQ